MMMIFLPRWGLNLPSFHFVFSLGNRILEIEKQSYPPRHPVVSATIDTARQVSRVSPTLPLSVLAFSSVEFERHEDITEALRRSGELLFRVARIRRSCLFCQGYVSLLDATISHFLFQSARRFACRFSCSLISYSFSRISVIRVEAHRSRFATLLIPC